MLAPLLIGHLAWFWIDITLMEYTVPANDTKHTASFTIKLLGRTNDPWVTPEWRLNIGICPQIDLLENVTMIG